MLHIIICGKEEDYSNIDKNCSVHSKGNESSIRCCAADRGQHSFLSDYVSAQGSERINEIQEKQVMEKCTDTVVNWMIRCNAINEADKELYKYAICSFFYWYHHLS